MIMKLTTENFMELILEKELTTHPMENATEVNLSNTNNNQLTLKCTTPTPIVLNASPDVTTP